MNIRISFKKIMNVFVIVTILLSMLKCLGNPKSSQAIVRLNSDFTTQSENLEIKNVSELRKFYIKSASGINLISSKEITVNIKDIAKGIVSKDLVDLNQYAILSAKVYNDNTLDKDALLLANNWEEVALETKIKFGKWYQYTTGGLGFKVWKNKNNNTVAIVYRGSQKEVGDWLSNSRWFFVSRYNPFIYDQYDQVRDSINNLSSEIESKFPKTTIVAVGHSLGGGLAQYAAYASNAIKHVYAFDPSPITGYYSVDTDTRKSNVKDLQIYRVYETGEILSYPRAVMKFFVPLSSNNPQIAEIKHNLISGICDQHNISSFANGLNAEYFKKE